MEARYKNGFFVGSASNFFSSTTTMLPINRLTGSVLILNVIGHSTNNRK